MEQNLCFCDRDGWNESGERHPDRSRTGVEFKVMCLWNFFQATCCKETILSEWNQASQSLTGFNSCKDSNSGTHAFRRKGCELLTPVRTEHLSISSSAKIAFYRSSEGEKNLFKSVSENGSKKKATTTGTCGGENRQHFKIRQGNFILMEIHWVK